MVSGIWPLDGHLLKCRYTHRSLLSAYQTWSYSRLSCPTRGEYKDAWMRDTNWTLLQLQLLGLVREIFIMSVERQKGCVIA